MNCYYCDLAGGPGGTRYGIRAAVGVCSVCGVGACGVHGSRDGKYLCQSCRRGRSNGDSPRPEPRPHRRRRELAGVGRD